MNKKMAQLTLLTLALSLPYDSWALGKKRIQVSLPPATQELPPSPVAIEKQPGTEITPAKPFSLSFPASLESSPYRGVALKRALEIFSEEAVEVVPSQDNQIHIRVESKGGAVYLLREELANEGIRFSLTRPKGTARFRLEIPAGTLRSLRIQTRGKEISINGKEETALVSLNTDHAKYGKLFVSHNWLTPEEEACAIVIDLNNPDRI